MVLVAKRKACVQPEKTHGYQYLFTVQFFDSNVYRDRHHRIRRQILRKNNGLIFILDQS